MTNNAQNDFKRASTSMAIDNSRIKIEHKNLNQFQQPKTPNTNQSINGKTTADGSHTRNKQ